MSKNQFRIPKPLRYQDGRYEWLPIVRVGRIVPWGYEQDPDDETLLHPIPDHLELLEQAKMLLKEYSLRDVAAWLTEHSGRSISHAGLRNRIQLEYKRYEEAANLRFLAQQYREAYTKAEKIEQSRIGRKVERPEWLERMLERDDSSGTEAPIN